MSWDPRGSSLGGTLDQSGYNLIGGKGFTSMRKAALGAGRSPAKRDGPSYTQVKMTEGVAEALNALTGRSSSTFAFQDEPNVAVYGERDSGNLVAPGSQDQLERAQRGDKSGQLIYRSARGGAIAFGGPTARAQIKHYAARDDAAMNDGIDHIDFITAHIRYGFAEPLSILGFSLNDGGKLVENGRVYTAKIQPKGRSRKIAAVSNAKGVEGYFFPRGAFTSPKRTVKEAQRSKVKRFDEMMAAIYERVSPKKAERQLGYRGYAANIAANPGLYGLDSAEPVLKAFREAADSGDLSTAFGKKKFSIGADKGRARVTSPFAPRTLEDKTFTYVNPKTKVRQTKTIARGSTAAQTPSGFMATPKGRSMGSRIGCNPFQVGATGGGGRLNLKRGAKGTNVDGKWMSRGKGKGYARVATQVCTPSSLGKFSKVNEDNMTADGLKNSKGKKWTSHRFDSESTSSGSIVYGLSDNQGARHTIKSKEDLSALMAANIAAIQASDLSDADKARMTDDLAAAIAQEGPVHDFQTIGEGKDKRVLWDFIRPKDKSYDAYKKQKL